MAEIWLTSRHKNIKQTNLGVLNYKHIAKNKMFQCHFIC